MLRSNEADSARFLQPPSSADASEAEVSDLATTGSYRTGAPHCAYAGVTSASDTSNFIPFWVQVSGGGVRTWTVQWT